MRRWLTYTWYGLCDGIGPLVGKELRARSRGWRPVVVVSLFLLLLALGVSGFLWLVSRAGYFAPNLGQLVFGALALGYVLLLAFLTPALGVGSISGERERRTLDLLLVTRASPLGIALGKLLASVVYVLYLILASLPAFAVVYLFGGVPPAMILLTILAAGVTAVGYASLGQFLSAVLRRTQAASVASYFLAFVLVFGTPFIGMVARQVRMSRPEPGMPPDGGPPPWYTYTSPLAALTALSLPGNLPVPILGGLVNDMFRYGGPVSPVAVKAMAVSGVQVAPPGMPPARFTVGGLAVSPRVTYVVSFPRGPGEPPKFRETWAPWVYHFAFSGLMVVASVVASAIRLGAGQGRWRLRLRSRARPRPRPAGV